jgi:predicted aldo/keto reductase-like oxidoreductase
MRYRRLGNSGLSVSAVGLGCNNFGRKLDAAATSAVVDAAIDAGVTSSTPPTSTATRAAPRRSCSAPR